MHAIPSSNKLTHDEEHLCLEQEVAVHQQRIELPCAPQEHCWQLPQAWPGWWQPQPAVEGRAGGHFSAPTSPTPAEFRSTTSYPSRHYQLRNSALRGHCCGAAKQVQQPVTYSYLPTPLATLEQAANAAKTRQAQRCLAVSIWHAQVTNVASIWWPSALL